MKRSALLSALVLTLVPAGDLIGADKHAWTGAYHWTEADNRGRLDAEFTATGEGTWDVAFHFTFQGEKHLYEGNATGSLTDGNLEGTVKNESRRRTFTFTGKVSDGIFTGTHAEIRRGQVRDTGTLQLSG